ncbi:SusC/RagA family TonB-linked outer membrane protein [Pedobacter sp. GR22-6]|uniref:SusC/RagA family TonB-linked outer membrane protein n=1 Tax=Pedobacter sp. GR22-6 TaxID=3127957 RepID=UPI00307CEF6E
MRITTVILIASFLQVSAAGFAQKISLNKTRAPLNEILNEIRNQSGYDFFYNNESVKKANPVTINVKEVSLEQALAICFENQPLAYQIDDKVVMIRIENQVYTFPDNMRFANIDVKVQVLDEKGEPLPGATVTIKGTSRKLVTGAGGTVTITVLDEKAVLLVSYLGYATQEVTIKKGQVSLTVKLVTEESQMNNVVVTGIFNKPKDSYTGAEHTITAKELKQFQGRNLFVTLGNIDPTFYVVPNNSAGSDPNRIPDIQIRGARSLPNIDQLQDQTAAALNTPLIILDEFETTLQRMMDLDNNEIESITLLKDGAATALYGSRGANGVVVIKTKEPIAGKLRLSYRFGMNLSVPDLGSYNLLNSADKLELERLSGYYQSSTKTPEANLGLQQYYNQILGQVAKGVNTDWLSVPLRTQIDQIHNLKIEGGDPTFRYDLALQYNNQNGAMKESGRKAFNGTINLSYRYKSLTFRNNLVIGQTKEHDSPYGSFSDYAKLNPYWEPYDASGKLNRYFSPFNWDYWTITSKYAGKPYPNPMYDATLNTFTRRSYTSITNNFQLEFRPVESILLKAGVGVIGNNSDADDFKPAEHSAFAGYDDSNLFRKGTYAYGSGKSFSYTTTLSASYNKLFAEKHRVYVGLSADMNENKSRNYGFAAEGFPDESIDFLGMGLQYQQNGSPDGSESTRRRIGMLGNINYALKDRYLADFAYRLDGASQFGVNRRFAPFWSAGLGWNMHYESFIKDNLLFVDRLKLRGSYGSTGSTQFDAYQALGTYSYVLNDRYKNWLGVQQNALGNPDLEWQQTNKYNLGLELALFKSRVTLEADVYLEKTSNLLSSLELPYSNGFTSYNENIGQLETRGFELRATTMLIKNDARGISWSLTGNLVHNRDKIVKLSEAMKAANEKLALQTAGDVAYSPNKIIREGTSQNTIYVVRSLGIDPSTGKELYLNKEGEVTYMWNARDRVAAGLDQPKFRGNFSTAFYYKSFSVGASFGYRFGGQLYNQTLIDKIENADRLFNVDERVYLERWKQPGDKTFFRGLNETLPVYASSRFVQDERTLTLQNVNLSYDVRNQKFLSRLGLQSLSVVGNTGELFYVSSVRQERGLDYPFTRQFSLSIYAAF